jgi:hypothetical protein
MNAAPTPPVPLLPSQILERIVPGKKVPVADGDVRWWQKPCLNLHCEVEVLLMRLHLLAC